MPTDDQRGRGARGSGVRREAVDERARYVRPEAVSAGRLTAPRLGQSIMRGGLPPLDYETVAADATELDRNGEPTAHPTLAVHLVTDSDQLEHGIETAEVGRIAGVKREPVGDRGGGDQEVERPRSSRLASELRDGCVDAAVGPGA